MTSSTPNLGLTLQDTGANINTWGSTLNSDVFTPIDTALGGAYAATLTNADVTLSAANALNLVHNLTGTLTTNVNYIFPSGVGRTLIINNGTSGAHTVTVKSSGGTGVVVPQGVTSIVYIDPSNNTAYIPSGYLTSLLAAGDIFIGNGNGTAAAQAITGFFSLNTAGSAVLGTGVVLGTNIGSAAITAYNLGTTGAAAGTYANAQIGVNAQGQVVFAGTSSNSYVQTVKRQVFTSATNTYTPSAGMLYADVEAWGGGGGGGGISGANQAAGGGGAGGYVRKLFAGTALGTSQLVFIGAAGAAGTSGGGSGGQGGTTRLGTSTMISATGGSGGANSGVPGSGGVGASGDINATGASGKAANSLTASFQMGGGGGNSSLGGAGGDAVSTGSTPVANDAVANSGSGGSGCSGASGASSHAGGAGAAGYMSITEYCSQ